MKKILIIAATALSFGLTAFFVIPQKSSAQLTAISCPPYYCKVVKIRKNIVTNNIIIRTNLGCMTQEQISKLPSLPITDPTIREYYEVYCF
ncbi:MAG: hypothetical protein BGO31_17340 [Bacteroidetes bacterium 43-16]|nr:MAG: hypothetical protein BGO31_17340 [Bacteroidetes bacterium 43-16]